jgi:hypothetical protein
MIHQVIEAKSGGVLDIRGIVKNFNLGPVGSNLLDFDDRGKHSGGLKLYDIAHFHLSSHSLSCQGIVKDDGHRQADRRLVKNGARSGCREQSQNSQ